MLENGNILQKRGIFCWAACLGDLLVNTRLRFIQAVCFQRPCSFPLHTSNLYLNPVNFNFETPLASPRCIPTLSDPHYFNWFPSVSTLVSVARIIFLKTWICPCHSHAKILLSLSQCPQDKLQTSHPTRPCKPTADHVPSPAGTWDPVPLLDYGDRALATCISGSSARVSQDTAFRDTTLSSASLHLTCQALLKLYWL